MNVMLALRVSCRHAAKAAMYFLSLDIFIYDII